MTKLTLVALAVICSRPSGYRRAGFSLEQGENQIDANKEQYDALNADKHLTVSIVHDESEFFADAPLINTNDLKEKYKLLLAEHDTLKNTVEEIRSISFAQQKIIAAHEETISLLEIEVANPPKYTHEDTVADLAGVGDRTFGFDCSSAPEELHPFIAVIDDLNKEAPLTKKPNCDLLTITVDDNSVTPTGAQRDAAWAWYQDNVKIVEVDTRETGE